VCEARADHQRFLQRDDARDLGTHLDIAAERERVAKVRVQQQLDAHVARDHRMILNADLLDEPAPDRAHHRHLEAILGETRAFGGDRLGVPADDAARDRTVWRECRRACVIDALTVEQQDVARQHATIAIEQSFSIAFEVAVWSSEDGRRAADQRVSRCKGIEGPGHALGM
jgi:hypothetical protein